MSRLAAAAGRLTFAAMALLGCGQLFAQETNPAEDLLVPLPIRDQFLLNNGFFFFEPATPRVLEPGRSLLTLQFADANTFAKSNWVSRSLVGQAGREPALAVLDGARFAVAPAIFLADGETHRLEIVYSRGFGRNLELGINLPLSTIGGGWSDGLIEAFHNALRIGNAEREALRQNSETVYLRTAAVDYVRSRPAGYALGDIALTAKYELTALEEEGILVALAGAVQLPTGNASTIDGSGSLDAGLQMVASRDLRWARVHASLGLLRLGADRPLGTRPRTVITDTVGASRLINPRTSVTIQLTVSESPFRNMGFAELNRRSYQMSFGMWRRVGGSTLAYAAFIENILTYENSADAGFAWGISRRF